MDRTIQKEGCSFQVDDGDNLYHGEPFWNAVAGDRWEKETFRMIKKYADPGRSFIDLGAWIGPTTLFGACLCRHVYAVEPDPVALETLKRNIGMNPHLKDKISLFEGCIGEKSGTETMGNNAALGNSETSLMFAGADNKIEVESLTFSDFMYKFSIEDCALVKMDVEGAELFALPDMIGFLSGQRPTMLLSMHTPLYGKQADQVKEMIFDILKAMYPYVYDASGNRISDISTIDEPFFDLVATHTA